MSSELSASYHYIQKNSCYNDHADHYPLDAYLCTDHIQSVFQRLPYCCSCKGSKKNTSTSKWGNTPDYTGSNTIHLIHVAGFHISHSCLCTKDKAYNTGTHRTYQICFHCGRNYIYAGKLCCIHVGSDSINMENLHRDGEISVRDMSCIQQDI